MFGTDATSLLFSILWSFATVGVGLACGFFIGRFHTVNKETGSLKAEKEATLKALLAVLQSTQQLNENVDTHNSALRSAKKDLEKTSCENDAGSGMDSLQGTLLSHITRVVAANRSLENDLVQTKYELESQAQELDRTRAEARTDSLCEIGNRKAFDEAFGYKMSCFEGSGSSFGLIIVDVDHFKRINDSFGHSAGDHALVSIGNALKECIRPQDFVGRLGGDEFAILLHGICNEMAEAVANRIRATIEQFDFSVGEGGESTVVTMSMGLTVVQPGDTEESIFKRADQALYRSKELGRNRIQTLLGDGKTSISTRSKLATPIVAPSMDVPTDTNFTAR